MVENSQYPVYINSTNLLGAERLCKIYLMRLGFTDMTIEKRKRIPEKSLTDDRILKADRQLKEALDNGYAIQLFDQE